MWKIRTDNSEENNIINGIRTKKFKPIFLSSRDKLKLKNEHIKRKVLKNPWTILEMTKIPPTSPVSPVWDYFVGRNSKNGMITWDYIVDVDHWVIIQTNILTSLSTKPKVLTPKVKVWVLRPKSILFDWWGLPKISQSSYFGLSRRSVSSLSLFHQSVGA